jgi:phenylpropionate dioxygenase-like ring-hydroxylating dioxygenase large terminal subunit
MDLRDFWYIAAESRELKNGQLRALELLGQWIVLFRDSSGRAVAIEDRCLHRCARLSRGSCTNGRLQCAYHGWIYDEEGRVVAIPSEGELTGKPRQARRFDVREQDHYIYVRPGEAKEYPEVMPFQIPLYNAPGWAHIRLRNRFANNVTNCVENFVDIPHTAFVHPRIFRDHRGEQLTATVRRTCGSVLVRYGNERANLGIFSRFLNPEGSEIEHTDAFHMPNVTCVDYTFRPSRRFIITSQSIPVGEAETLVYTDLTYHYGIWNRLARPIIRRQAQKIIDQDIAILGEQMEVIKKFGASFSNSRADIIHVFIESIRNELERGKDPRLLPDKEQEIEFRV